MAAKTLTIDGKQVSADESATILDAATDAGIKIPTLCHLDGVYDVGACRLCLVEVTGISKLLPACTTKVSEGMDIKTDSERLRKYRRMTLELLFAERNHVLRGLRGPTAIANSKRWPTARAWTTWATTIAFRNGKWITRTRCSGNGPQPVHSLHRCVRVLLAHRRRGHQERLRTRRQGGAIITDLNQPWGTSETCTKCGKCVMSCPHGGALNKGSTVGEMERDRTKLESSSPQGRRNSGLLTSMQAKQEMETKQAPGQPGLLRLATAWFGGCSGCHMSFLDLDEFLIDVAGKVDLVYSPVIDVKEYPEDVDVCLVEGAICNEDNLELIHKVRARTKVLVSFGDCAVTANVPAIRNQAWAGQRGERAAARLCRGRAEQSGRAQRSGHRAAAPAPGDARTRSGACELLSARLPAAG